MSKTLKIKLVRSHIGRPEKHRRILKSLGMTRMHRVRELPDNASVRGMIFLVSHMVQIVD
ncbi:MAG: 50S ribosomal protein L30 [Magnetococcus sp. DMHC-1]|nr:50S ribosomal protein L30 [Magnetococcales bacterium]MBF0152402.1 50S ribosomal protein L30 [Magnetococcales bacterium]